MLEIEINLAEYQLALNEEGNVVQQDGIVSLRCIADGTIVEVNYNEVADYYGLQAMYNPGTGMDALMEDQMNLNRSPTDNLPTPETTQPLVTPRTVVTWTDDQTKFMLAAYRKYMDKVGPLQKLKNKKQLWSKISLEMLEELGVEFTPQQVENRWKNVLKRTKIAVKNNRTSGSTIMRTPYDAEMAQITALDDSIEPEVLMTPTTIRRKTPVSTLDTFPAKRRMFVQDSTQELQPSTSSAPTCTMPTVTDPPSSPLALPQSHRSSKDIQAKFLDAYLMECENRQTRAEDKQKRHDQKMEKLEKLTDIFTNIVNNMANR